MLIGLRKYMRLLVITEITRILRDTTNIINFYPMLTMKYLIPVVYSSGQEL